MSEPSLPAENRENPNEAKNGVHLIKYDFCEYFRFRPIAFLQFLLSQADTEDGTTKQKQFGARVLQVGRRIATSNPSGIVVVTLVLAVLAWFLYRLGVFKAANLTALSGVILAVWAGMTWWTYRGQWQVMREQLDSARIASGQTDQIIEQMRLDQRAWIGLVDLKTSPISANNPITCDFFVKNSGNTPGFIDSFSYCYILAAKDEDPGPTIEKRGQVSGTIHAGSPIPPGEVAGLPTTVAQTVDENAFHRIGNNSATLYFFCDLRYHDIFGETRHTRCCFSYNPSSGALTIHPGHNHMD
jgi:hypothetical protein